MTQTNPFEGESSCRLWAEDYNVDGQWGLYGSSLHTEALKLLMQFEQLAKNFERHLFFSDSVDGSRFSSSDYREQEIRYLSAWLGEQMDDMAERVVNDVDNSRLSLLSMYARQEALACSVPTVTLEESPYPKANKA